MSNPDNHAVKLFRGNVTELESEISNYCTKVSNFTEYKLIQIEGVDHAGFHLALTNAIHASLSEMPIEGENLMLMSERRDSLIARTHSYIDPSKQTSQIAVEGRFFAVYSFLGMDDDNRYTEIELILSGDIGAVVRVKIFLDELHKDYTRSSDPSIKHLDIGIPFLNRKGELEFPKKSMSTADFADLLPSMYPGMDYPKLMAMYAHSKESILILQGPPGTGKTCMLKMIMAGMAIFIGRDIDCVYVKDSNILSRNEFWVMLTANPPEILILDDLDDQLSPRTEVNQNDIVNQILSFTDGVFKNKTKVVITTNRDSKHIDSAVVRPGRCFDVLTIPSLLREEAKKVWVEDMKLPEKDFEDTFGTATHITQADLASERTRVEFSEDRDYLLDKSISIRTKFV